MLSETASVACAVELEHVACPLCGADDAAAWYALRDHLFARTGEYQLVRCRRCAAPYLNLRPTAAALREFYPEAYFCFQPLLAGRSPDRAMGGLAGTLARRRIRQLERHVGRIPSGAHILDVGCGANAFLYHLHRLRGCDTLGVDTSAAVVRAIREHLHLPAAEGPLPGLALPAASFDGVAMYEYLEHEPRPREVLAEARRLSRPGAWLVIETPDASTPMARLFGRKWCQWDAPRHLVLFDRPGITRLLQESGYELLAVRRLTYQWMFGFSVLVALGFRRLGRLRPLEAALAVAATLPFLPLPWIWPEFMRVYARAR